MLKLISIATFVICLDKSFAGEVDEKFRAAKIVDDLLPKAPDTILDVEFDCGFTTLGNKFAPIQVRNRPKVTWKGAKETELYSLIMTDARNKSEFLHWHVGNIPGNDVDKGDVLTMFFPSAPPKDSGEHRYVFLLYKQPEKIDFQGHIKISTFEMEDRDKFSTKAFADEFRFNTPVAGNFYLAAWDKTCNELYILIEDYEKKKN